MTQSMATKKLRPRVQTGRAVKFEVATSFEGACIFLLKPNTFLLSLVPLMYRDGSVLALPQAPPLTLLSLCDHKCFAEPCLSLVQKEKPGMPAQSLFKSLFSCSSWNICIDLNVLKCCIKLLSNLIT